jgi:orotidine-5'-phosphate decarboxylase
MSMTRYLARCEAINSLLCVGLDSDIHALPERFKTSATPQLDFNQWIIDQTHQYTCSYKLNSAFYEARGAQGWQEMAQTVAYIQANHPDIFTICDAKRADIGNTNRGYVEAIFDEIGFDAITLHPYLGGKALAPFLERDDKVSIILCRTSNPDSAELQGLTVGDDKPLWLHVAETIAQKWNDNKNCMLVMGATYPDELKAVRDAVGDDVPFLVPGIGAQGGDIALTVQSGQNSVGGGMLINASRGIIFTDNPAESAKSLYEAINQYRTTPA